jgi:hypothetical protein
MKRFVTLAPVVALLIGAASAQFVSTGGRWLKTVSKDSMSDRPSVSFILFADHQEDESARASVQPHLRIFCSGSGKITGFRLYPGETLAMPDMYSPPSAFVGVRVDDKLTTEVFALDETAQGPFRISNGILKKVLQAKEVRFRYSLVDGGARTLVFHPAGLDRPDLSKSCGLEIAGETLPSVSVREATNGEAED